MIKRILSTDISESIVKSKEDIKNENFIISESLLLKDEETEFDFGDYTLQLAKMKICLWYFNKNLLIGILIILWS